MLRSIAPKHATFRPSANRTKREVEPDAAVEQVEFYRRLSFQLSWSFRRALRKENASTPRIDLSLFRSQVLAEDRSGDEAVERFQMFRSDQGSPKSPQLEIGESLIRRPGIALDRVTARGEELHVGSGGGVGIGAGLGVEEFPEVCRSDVRKKRPEDDPLARVLWVCPGGGRRTGIDCVELRASGRVQEAVNGLAARFRRLVEARAEEQ